MIPRIAICVVLAPALLTTPAFADPRIDDIRAEVRAGNAERAEELAEELLDAEPENAEAHNVYAEVLTVRINQVNIFRKPGMAGRMRKAWERAVELEPEHLDAHRSLMQYYLQAPAIAGGSREKALAQAERIGEIDRAAGFRALAGYWMAQDDSEKALDQYRQAVTEFPDDIGIRLEYGFMCQRREDWACAHREFTHATELESDEATMAAHYQVGRTAVMSGQNLDAGVASLERYLSHAPGDGQPPLAWAHTRLGQVYLHMDRTDDARAQFEAALALEPDHEEAKKQLAEIE